MSGKAFEIRDHRLEKPFEQGLKLPRGLLFFEKPADISQVIVEIFCDADSTATAHRTHEKSTRLGFFVLTPCLGDAQKPIRLDIGPAPACLLK